MTEIMWHPTMPEKTNMWQFMQFVNTQHQCQFNDYEALHHWSINNIGAFWKSLCDFFNIQFDTPPQQIVNNYTDMLEAYWFKGARFNFAEKLLSREDEHTALISINENGHRKVLTYKELREAVSAVAAGLKASGVGVGDRVAAVMPNVSYTIIAMLATSSLGAIWSSCSPDFGKDAIVDRLGQISPKVLFLCDGQQYHGKVHSTLNKLQDINSLIPSLTHIVICPIIDSKQQNIAKSVSWDAFLKPNQPLAFTSLPFDHPLYILYSSGTTGKPKCITHGAGGTLLQHIKELGLHTDLKSRDNLLFYTTCGWMMWNWMASTLALGATLTLYDGAPTFPDENRLFQLIENEKVTVFGTSAKYLSSIEKAKLKPNTINPLTALRCILSTGSPLLPKNYDFVYQHISPSVQLCSISGGTDIVSCFALGNPILPVRKGELQCLGLGMAVEVFTEEGQSIRNEKGELVCTKPFPSMPVGFWNDPNKIAYRKAYFQRFPGIWAHGDYAEITPNHGLIIYGRSDAILNPGGVRIGTAEIYRQIETLPEIIDSVVIGQNWQDDVRIVLFVKLQNHLQLTSQLEETIRQTIKKNTSPRHVPAKILQVPDIPKTINGKVVEIAVRQVVHGDAVANVQSIANPEALDYFKNREELQ